MKARITPTDFELIVDTYRTYIKCINKNVNVIFCTLASELLSICTEIFCRHLLKDHFRKRIRMYIQYTYIYYVAIR